MKRPILICNEIVMTKYLSLSENNWHLRSNIFSDLFLFLLKVYWCSPPENMTFDNLTDWFVMSGQLDSLERCHVYDVDYHKVEK
jgi:hypothetical protein